MVNGASSSCSFFGSGRGQCSLTNVELVRLTRCRYQYQDVVQEAMGVPASEQVGVAWSVASTSHQPIVVSRFVTPRGRRRGGEESDNSMMRLRRGSTHTHNRDVGTARVARVFSSAHGPSTLCGTSKTSGRPEAP